MSGNAGIGTVAGGILGGTAGFFVGGPAGAAYGAGIGAGIGGGVGSSMDAKEAQKELKKSMIKPIEPTKPMPTINDDAVKKARNSRLLTLQKQSGAASTILTGDKFGG